MLKIIPKSSINQRTFKVHKKFIQTEATNPIYIGQLASDGAYESSSAATTNGVSNHSLYASIKHKYYRNDGNIFNTFGEYSNLGQIALERTLEDAIRVISVPQSKRGLGIKPGSVTLYDTDSDALYTDNSSGTITSNIPQYSITDLDFGTGIITLTDSDNESFTGTITSLDLQSGISTMTFGNDTDNVEIVLLDLQNGILRTSSPLDFDGLEIDTPRFGNIFYSDGLIVLADSTNIVSYSLDYRSTETITEQEILLTAKAGEFNYSQNPSAVEIQVSGSYDFVTTAIPNVSSARTRKITEYSDIKRREFYSGSFNPSVSGSWDDYYTSSSVDKVGSYLSTYISTIGLYDDAGEMVAVAKLPKPIKNLPNYDVNFIVRFDV
jgi:hypothetical protein